MNTMIHTGVAEATNAYDQQSKIFDELYGADTMIAWKRQRVRNILSGYLQPGASILELNSGTGEDASWFARQGHFVHATDISTGMQEQLQSKMKKEGLDQLVTNEVCSFTELEHLKKRGPYDLVFSNFGGLNCSPHLDRVLSQLPALIKPGGHAVLVFIPAFCLWEFLLLFRGKFRTAFRRFTGKKGARAKLDDQQFRCWYYSPAKVKKQLQEDFLVAGHEGLCTIAPPSYIEAFDKKHPKIWQWLTAKEMKYSRKWPWCSCGDYVILSLQRRS